MIYWLLHRTKCKNAKYLWNQVKVQDPAQQQEIERLQAELNRLKKELENIKTDNEEQQGQIVILNNKLAAFGAGENSQQAWTILVNSNWKKMDFISEQKSCF